MFKSLKDDKRENCRRYVAADLCFKQLCTRKVYAILEIAFEGLNVFFSESMHIEHISNHCG
jgi:hypothetical protein